MIPKFLRPEALLYVAIERLAAPPAPSIDALRARLTDSAPPEKPRVICAWCPDFDPTTQAPGLSHGMCQACSDRALFQTMTSIREPQPRDEPRDDDETDREEFGGSTCGTACGYCGRCS